MPDPAPHCALLRHLQDYTSKSVEAIRGHFTSERSGRHDENQGSKRWRAPAAGKTSAAAEGEALMQQTIVCRHCGAAVSLHWEVFQHIRCSRDRPQVVEGDPMSEEMRRAAYHEAGHAVVALWAGAEVTRVRLKGEGTGTCTYETPGGKGEAKAAIAGALISLAGTAAEVLLLPGTPSEARWATDRHHARMAYETRKLMKSPWVGWRGEGFEAFHGALDGVLRVRLRREIPTLKALADELCAFDAGLEPQDIEAICRGVVEPWLAQPTWEKALFALAKQGADELDGLVGNRQMARRFEARLKQRMPSLVRR
jgi:hypothetical protein